MTFGWSGSVCSWGSRTSGLGGRVVTSKESVINDVDEVAVAGRAVPTPVVRGHQSRCQAKQQPKKQAS